MPTIDREPTAILATAYEEDDYDNIVQVAKLFWAHKHDLDKAQYYILYYNNGLKRPKKGTLEFLYKD